MNSPNTLERSKTDRILSQAAAEFGTPTYVYFNSIIQNRVEQLNRTLGQYFSLSYAVKSNPNPSLLNALSNYLDLLDISSIGEMQLATNAGWPSTRISFTGPGKRDYELKEAICAGVGELVVESPQEAYRANAICASINMTQDILLRIAPPMVPKGFGDQMAGKPCAFGIDYEVVEELLPEILALSHLNLVGLHIYSGTQCLVDEAICENYRQFIGIFRSICERFNLSPRKLIFGSGLGLPYHDSDKDLNLENISKNISADLIAMKSEPRYTNTQLVLELGRYLVGPAGYFLTQVVATKLSRGVQIAICDGGMNNHLPASGNFGMVIQRNYRMHKVGDKGAEEETNLTGPLCTSIDRIANKILLPKLEPGDLIAIHNSGAYGLTASPIHFISHKIPREILVQKNQLQNISRSWESFP
ncbi:MAG: type III PLP-dependent enzyme [Kordiimonas sp.]